MGFQTKILRRKKKPKERFDKQKFDRIKFRSTVIAVLIMCGISAGSKLLPASERLLDRWDMAVYDFVMRKLAKPPASVNDVVVLPITDEGLEYFSTRANKGWPWPRSYYVHLIKYCRDAGARAIFFDLLFTDPSPYDDDPDLAAGLTEWERVYILGDFRENELHGQVKGEQFEEYVKKFSVPVEIKSAPEKERTVKTIRFPVQDIAGGATRLCDPMVPKEIDGKIRRMNLLTRYGDRYFLSQPLAIVWDLEGRPPITVEKEWLSFGSHRIPIDNEGTMLVKYYGQGAKTFKTYHAHDVIRSNANVAQGEPPVIAKELLKDKIVFVGTYLAGIDMKDTPVDRFYPGVEIGATTVANILANDYMRELPRIWIIAMTLFYMASSCFLFRYIKPFLCKYALYGFIGVHGAITVVAFQNDVWVQVIPQAMGVLSSYITSIALNYVYEGKQRQMVKKTFQSYVSPAVVNKILNQSRELKLDGEKKMLTVLFLDIEGFTTMSEKLTPEDAVALLNRCFTRFHTEINATEGNIDKFVGDAVIAFWGDPLPMADHAERACRSAVAIQKAMTDINLENNSQLNIRIGINSAEVTVGNMGSEKQFNYTVIGDGVNFASRLEGANKEFGTKILVSDATYQMAKEGIEVREVGLIRVVGKTQPVRIYEVMGEKGKLEPADQEIVTLHAQGLAEFRGGGYRRASQIFADTTHRRAKPDKLAKLYTELSDKFASAAEKPAGEYVHELKSK